MIVVWFSCGVASAVAAKVTLATYGNQDVRIVNCPVAEEDGDNLRFKLDVEELRSAYESMKTQYETKAKMYSDTLILLNQANNTIREIGAAPEVMRLLKERDEARADVAKLIEINKTGIASWKADIATRDAKSAKLVEAIEKAQTHRHDPVEICLTLRLIVSDSTAKSGSET